MKVSRIFTVIYALSLALASASNANARVFVVTNNSGNINIPNSLPWAINQANFFSRGLDFITFNVPSSPLGVNINIDRTLFINDQLVIDGTSQPGYVGRPIINILGNSSTANIFLIQNDASLGVNSSGSTIQGLAITGFSLSAITFRNTSVGNYIQNNWIGFLQSSSTSVSLNRNSFSTSTGIVVQSSKNVIRNNTISGVNNGIVVGEPVGVTTPADQYITNSITGNRIGTDPTGTTSSRYGNSNNGISLASGARENFVGPNNVVSGNNFSGVQFVHPTSQRNVVFLNNIGTDISGRFSIPNTVGIELSNNSAGNAIGGPFGGNIISGNSLAGISIGGDLGPSNSNFIQNNIVGLNASQTAPVPVLVSGQPSSFQAVGAFLIARSRGNQIMANVFSGNLLSGFLLQDVQSNGIFENWIGRSAFQTSTRVQNINFGIALLPGASFNFVQRNAFGINPAGNIFLDPAALGNAIN